MVRPGTLWKSKFSGPSQACDRCSAVQGAMDLAEGFRRGTSQEDSGDSLFAAGCWDNGGPRDRRLTRAARLIARRENGALRDSGVRFWG